jgi:hypothetical protein
VKFFERVNVGKVPVLNVRMFKEECVVNRGRTGKNLL